MDLPQPETQTNHLDPYEKPPEILRAVFKNFKGRFDEFKASKEGVVNFEHEGAPATLPYLGRIPQHLLLRVLSKFQEHEDPETLEASLQACGKVYKSEKIPGLLVLPSLLPSSSQKALLSRLLHRDLSNPKHKTNLHLHYGVSYPEKQASFFAQDPGDISFQPIDTNIHKSISIKSALDKKMRWVTLGGQYDWTNKLYPPETPPEFPSDIAELLGSIFPDMEPQAAIVNFYSPGDTLSLHRDVSEEVDRGLVSISLGCDAVFIIGLHDDESGETRSMVLRLRSGDAVYMQGESRFAWHAVPCIIPDTCPEYLRDWPGDEYPAWKDWMQKKRINLNVRQMRESTMKRESYSFVSLQENY